MNEVKLGALCWNQYTDWPSLLEAGVRADRLGYSSLWTWDQRYPEWGRNDLRARFREGSDDSFGGAFRELYLHESLTRTGFDVTLRPAVTGTTRRPDFLAARSGEPGFCVETTLAGASRDERAADQRLDAIYDLLNGLPTPSFYLDVEVEQEGTTPPATRSLRRDLLSELLATAA